MMDARDTPTRRLLEMARVVAMLTWTVRQLSDQNQKMHIELMVLREMEGERRENL